MDYKFHNYKKNADGCYGPTIKGKFYKSMSYHSKNAKTRKGKTIWYIPENGEYEVFKISNESDWECKKMKGFFSLLLNCKIQLGDNGEKLAFFPNTVNINDPYHGYPVFSQEYSPSDELLDKWYNDKVIDDVTKRRLEVRKI